MSRIQPPYLPTHRGDVGTNGSDTGLVPFTAHDIPLNILEHDSAEDRGELWIQVSTPNDLEGVKKATVNVLRQIQGKLSKCRLTKAEEGRKDQIFNSLDKIAGVLLTVLRAHRDAASGIEHIVDFPTTQGDIVQTVEGHLASAWNSIEKASNEFIALREQILEQSKLLKEGADPPPGFLKRQAHKAVNRELPGKSSFPSLAVAITSIVVNSAAAAELAQRLPGAVTATNVLGVLAIIFGSAMQAANYIGKDAAIYEPKARETTQKALDCIHQHLLQFCRALSSLQTYWADIHSTVIEDAEGVTDPLELLCIVTLLERHVDDCLVVVSAIQNLSLPMTVTPTQLDIDDERNGITHGVFGLPSDPH